MIHLITHINPDSSKISDVHFSEGDQGIDILFTRIFPNALLSDSDFAASVGRSVTTGGIHWIKRGTPDWVVDLDAVRESFPRLIEIPWLTGSHLVAPRVTRHAFNGLDDDDQPDPNSTIYLLTFECRPDVQSQRKQDGKSKVFLSYSRKDAATAEGIRETLINAGCDVWMDRHCLLPGQDWRSEVVEAIAGSDFVMLLLSNQSVDERGYFQKELRLAVDTLDGIPDNQIFLLPVRLDDCRIPRSLTHLHCVDWFDDPAAALQRVLDAVMTSTQLVSSSSEAIAPPDETNNDESLTYFAVDDWLQENQLTSFDMGEAEQTIKEYFANDVEPDSEFLNAVNWYVYLFLMNKGYRPSSFSLGQAQIGYDIAPDGVRIGYGVLSLPELETAFETMGDKVTLKGMLEHLFFEPIVEQSFEAEWEYISKRLGVHIAFIVRDQLGEFDVDGFTFAPDFTEPAIECVPFTRPEDDEVPLFENTIIPSGAELDELLKGPPVILLGRVATRVEEMKRRLARE